MTVPPANQVGPKVVDQDKMQPPPPPVVKEKVTLGYIWKKIKELPSNFIALIVKISHAVKGAFGSSTQTSSSPMRQATKDIGTSHPATSKVFNRQVAKQEDEEEDLNLDDLFGTTEEEANPPEEKAKPAEAKPAEKKVMADPLKKGGAIGPGPGISAAVGEVGIIGSQVDIAANMDKLGSIVSPIKEDKAQRDEWLDIANDVVSIAKVNLKTKPKTHAENDHTTKVLDREYKMLKDWLLSNKDTSEGAKLIVRTTIEAIEEKMTELGEAILSSAVEALQDIEAENAAELQDYLRLTNELNDVIEPLTVFASRFENTAPIAHYRVQEMIQALERKKTSLDTEMCAQVKLHFKPNSKIKHVGNCMFESVSNQREKKTENQGLYRKRAVDYIRAHLDDAAVYGITYRDSIIDAMFRDEALSKLQSRAGRNGDLRKAVDSLIECKKNIEECKKKIRKEGRTDELARELHELELASERLRAPLVNLYLACMEKTTIYGGTNELLALSESLKAPIILFTQNDDGKTWRYDFIAGETKYSDTPPVLLYYNGVNHYQDLISR